MHPGQRFLPLERVQIAEEADVGLGATGADRRRTASLPRGVGGGGGPAHQRCRRSLEPAARRLRLPRLGGSARTHRIEGWLDYPPVGWTTRQQADRCPVRWPIRRWSSHGPIRCSTRATATQVVMAAAATSPEVSTPMPEPPRQERGGTTQGPQPHRRASIPVFIAAPSAPGRSDGPAPSSCTNPWRAPRVKPYSPSPAVPRAPRDRRSAQVPAGAAPGVRTRTSGRRPPG